MAKSAGYKSVASETLMSRHVNARHLQEDKPVKSIQNANEANWFNEQRKQHLIWTDHLNDERVIDFYIEEQNVLAASARAIFQDGLVVADNVYTNPDFRRRGLATRLMAEVAYTSCHWGAKREVLLSTHEGYPLYLKAGFEEHATLSVFSSAN